MVECDIPLHLSKDSLKKANTVFDLTTDRATMFGEAVDLELTSSGHYCVGLLKKEPHYGPCNEDGNVDEVLAVHVDPVCKDGDILEEVLPINADEEVDFRQNWDKLKLLKLHRQFGHASVEKLKPFLKGAGILDSKVYDTLSGVI